VSDEPLPIPEHTAREARDRLVEILSRKEFRPRSKSLVERFANWVGDVLDRLFSPFSRPSVGSLSALDWVATAVLAALVVVVVIRLTRTMRSGAGRRREPSAPLVTKRTARAWRREAEDHERTGAWRQALRCRYRALLAELIDRSVVADVAGRTAGEYRAEARRRLPSLGEPFSGATDLFEAAWYGNEAVGPDEARRFQALADEALAVAGPGTGRADGEPGRPLT